MDTVIQVGLFTFTLREKPLALYVFTESKQTFEKINRLTSAGGVTHNDTLMHFSRESRNLYIYLIHTYYSLLVLTLPQVL